MNYKDYYAILEIEPSASLTDIKKAYRKWAHLLHPDKAGTDPHAAARFAAIKEAYEVLADPSKKEYYLQERWYRQSMGRKKSTPLITPENILNQAIELEKYVSRLDPFRLDREGLLQYILELYNADTITKLKAFEMHDIAASIIKLTLKATQPLKSVQAAQVAEQLKKLAGTDKQLIHLIETSVQQNQRNENKERRAFLYAIILTILVCLLIYLTGR